MSKVKTKRKHRKPIHEDGVPSPHGFMADPGIRVPGGRIHFDVDHLEWVALAVDRSLGRFPTQETAMAALLADSRLPKRGLPDVDPNRHEQRHLGAEDDEIEAWAERQPRLESHSVNPCFRRRGRFRSEARD